MISFSVRCTTNVFVSGNMLSSAPCVSFPPSPSFCSFSPSVFPPPLSPFVFLCVFAASGGRLPICRTISISLSRTLRVPVSCVCWVCLCSPVYPLSSPSSLNTLTALSPAVLRSGPERRWRGVACKAFLLALLCSSTRCMAGLRETMKEVSACSIWCL